MNASKVMVEYLRLSASERGAFDKLYARRDVLQPLHDMMAAAEPKQLQQVREWLGKGPVKGTANSEVDDRQKEWPTRIDANSGRD